MVLFLNNYIIVLQNFQILGIKSGLIWPINEEFSKFFKALGLGSVSRSVSERVTCPVLIIRWCSNNNDNILLLEMGWIIRSVNGRPTVRFSSFKVCYLALKSTGLYMHAWSSTIIMFSTAALFEWYSLDLIESRLRTLSQCKIVRR